MKVFTKYLLTLLLLGIASVVNAQESEALLADGTYYIKNVASGNFFTGANNWGTQASVAPSGAPFEVTLLPEGGYSLKYLLSTADNTHLGSNLYVDSQTPDGGFAIEKNEDDTFVIKLDGKYLAEGTETGPTNDAIVVQTEELTAAAKWQFITIDEAVAAMKQTAPANATFLISNPNFNRNTSTAAWTVSADCTNRNLGGGGNGNFCAESWHSVFTISQVLANAPAGRYSLTAQGFYRPDVDPEEDAPVIFALICVFKYRRRSDNNAAASATVRSVFQDPRVTDTLCTYLIFVLPAFKTQAHKESDQHGNSHRSEKANHHKHKSTGDANQLFKKERNGSCETDYSH